MVCRQLMAKQQHVEVLLVTNWLSKPQRFTISIARDGDGSDVPEATFIMTPFHIDVPALADKACKIAITPYAASPIRTTVTFTNDATGEFLYYDLDCTVQEAPSVGELVLSTPVRTTVRKAVTITNPLDRELVLTGTCTSNAVTFPATFTLPPGRATPIEVCFMPLLATEASSTLTYSCTELGAHTFALWLCGQPTPADKSLSFKVALGRAETRTVTFRHFNRSPTTYTIKLAPEATADGFSAPATLPAPAAPEGGADMDLAVTFLPTHVAELFRRSLMLSSSEGGEYECLLVGRCTPPAPQGPIRVAGGKAVTMPFMNPFKIDAEFRFCCDNPAFVLKQSETIKAQQHAQIAVVYREIAGRPKTAMLTVTCPSSTSCQWVFYLEA
jgi:hydrocephalus-inducing protein